MQRSAGGGAGTAPCSRSPTLYSSLSNATRPRVPGKRERPAIAGLSRFPGTRGRVAFDNEEYTVGERLQGAVPAPPPADLCIPLYVWREGALIPLHDFSEMKPYDRLLFIVPLSQFRGREQAIRGERSSELAAT